MNLQQNTHAKSQEINEIYTCEELKNLINQSESLFERINDKLIKLVKNAEGGKENFTDSMIKELYIFRMFKFLGYFSGSIISGKNIYVKYNNQKLEDNLDYYILSNSIKDLKLMIEVINELDTDFSNKEMKIKHDYFKEILIQE